MPLKFNPFSGNFDFAPGVGGTVFDGEVNVFSDLPETVSNPPVNSAYLVRNTEGTIWFGNRKQKGIYIRSGNSGVRNDDWTYGGDYPVTSVNGLTGAVVLDADDVGAAIGLEYIGQSIDSAGNINVLANKHYTFTKNANDNISIRLPTTANDGDRIVIRRSGNNTQGVLTIDRLGGMPSVQTIGVLTAPNTVFFAVWTGGLWRQDFIPPAGFQGAPASISAFGSAGQMAYQDPHLYICVDSNTWRRVTLTTF